MIRYKKGLFKDYNFNIRLKRSHHGKDKNKYYCDDIFTFDIETTSAFINDYGNVIKYKRGFSDDYWNDLTALSLCYEWTFGINDTYYYGRELTDFINVLDELPATAHIIIWVHNLSFEFHFLLNILNDITVFARMPHKPMKFSSGLYPKIEFRCTYMLTRLSLAAWARQLGTKKMIGDLDYNKIRTPLTPLTDKELGYCERDCKVVYLGILDYLKKYGTQDKIPLTQTGTVRREVKNRLCCYPDYVKYMKKLVPKNAAEYKMLQQVFAGGYTHANRKYAGQTIDCLVEHRDFASSYPTVMVCEKYPMTAWAYTGLHEIPDINTFDDYAYIMHVTFKNIDARLCNTYIQQSKSECINAKWDNGRLIKADSCDMWITEQDYLIIRDAYKFKLSDVEVHAVYKSYKQYLPKIFVEYILKLYGNKTSLKNVAGSEALYLQSKQYINSLFGMMVTAIVQSDITFNENEDIENRWSIGALDVNTVEQQLEKLRSYNPREKRYFLSYSWGIYVTAYARRNIWKVIAKYDSDVIYADTDSTFTVGKKDLTWYNDEITAKLKKACDDMQIDFNLCAPSTPKGVKKQLGLFELEDYATEFRTLGAKRYCLRNEKTEKLELTVSGINKDAVYILHNDIDNFNEGLCFDKDFPTITKKLTTYCSDMPIIKYPDGYVSTYKEGINLRPTGYTITIPKEYNDIIAEFMNFNIGELSDNFKNHLRGIF